MPVGHSRFARWDRLPGPRTGAWQRLPMPASTIAVELALFGHPLKSLFGAFDAVLVVVAIGRKQFHDLIAAIDGHMADRARREENRLTYLELVLFQLIFQRDLLDSY